MTTLNVNLKPCNCAARTILKRTPPPHLSGCTGQPIPLPCPIPRSVTFEARLGDCTMGCQSESERARPTDGHWNDCPASPIRVSCSIGGETWAESEVVEWDASIGFEDVALMHRIRDACCERWEIVKALVTGAPCAGEDTLEYLFAQRDAVFAALATMARAEEEAWDAQEHIVSALDEWHANDWHLNPTTQRDVLPSTKILAAYVSHLIAKVGAL